jgi:hypothetical protein
MSEAEKPTECPKCGSKAQKVITSFGSKTGNSIQPAREPLRRDEVDSRDQPALSSDLAGDIKPLPLSGHLGNGASAGRKEMAQKSLVQMLEDLANKVRSLEVEKTEAVARAQALEHENSELIGLITLAGEKVDEILKIGATDDAPQPPAVNTPAASTAPEQLGEFSAEPQREPKGRSVRPWRSS